MKKIFIIILFVPLLLSSVELFLEDVDLYGGLNTERFHDGVITADGNMILCGTSKGETTDMLGIYIIKMDQEGNVIWEISEESSIHVVCNKIVECSDGNFVIMLDISCSNYYPRLIKINSDGEILWQHDFPEYGSVRAFTPINSNDYALFGLTFDPLENWLIKVNDSGEIVWEQITDFYNPDFDWINTASFTEAINSNEFIGAFTGNNDTVIKKIDTDGVVIWEVVLEGSDVPKDPMIRRVKLINDQYHVLTTSNYNIHHYILSDNGEIISEFIYDFTYFLNARDMVWLPEIGYIYLSHRYNHNYDSTLFVANEVGEILYECFAFIDQQINVLPSAIITDNIDKIWVLGDCEVYDPVENFQARVERYSVSNTISTNTEVNQQKPSLTNYPNPFNPSTTINFNLTTECTEDTEIEIYNVKGQKIKSFLIPSSTLSPINSITWNGTDHNNNPVSSGIYYAVLKTGSKQIQNKKMLLLK